jgi:hypothetical protein
MDQATEIPLQHWLDSQEGYVKVTGRIKDMDVAASKNA